MTTSIKDIYILILMKIQIKKAYNKIHAQDLAEEHKTWLSDQSIKVKVKKIKNQIHNLKDPFQWSCYKTKGKKV